MAPSETSPPSIANPRYSNTPEKQDSDLKSHLMVETFKKDINNFIKETQENTVEQVEDLNEETNKFLKKYRKIQSIS